MRWLPGLLAALAALLPLARAGGSTLEELCDCNTPTSYGFKCACGDPSNDPSIKGCCNIGRGSCTDFCRARQIDKPVDQNDPVALRAEVARLKKLLKDQPPPPPPPPPPGSAGSASGLPDPQQKKVDALEAAFQTRAISLAQYEVAAAALAAEIAASVPPPPPARADGEETDCTAALSCEDCRKLDCAWCIGGRKCVEDKPWICAGDTDHIGKIGKVKQCPAPAELERLFASRRERELEAAAELERLRATAETCSPDEAAAGGCSSDSSAEEGEGGAAAEDPELAKQRHAEDLARRVENAAAGKGGKDQPYAVLGVAPEATQGEIRKVRKHIFCAILY